MMALCGIGAVWRIIRLGGEGRLLLEPVCKASYRKIHTNTAVRELELSHGEAML